VRPRHNRRTAALAAIGSVLAVLFSLLGTSAATASSHIGASLATGGVACPATRLPGQMECLASLRHFAGAASVIHGYGPAALRSAYNVSKASASDGGGATIAIVSAFDDPNAASDLAVYRSHYRLRACTEATGCLRIVNELGRATPLPAAATAWASLDSIALDAISALCPRCRLLLVEAKGNGLTDLGTAEDTAVSKGARFIVNGWGGIESLDENNFAHYFNHPGVAVVFAAGTAGYGSDFPAALPFVTAVGGTTLRRSSFNSRHWAEIAWSSTTSACSSLEPKPSWQRADASSPDGCLNRTQNDVAADADPATGAAVYDTFSSTGWAQAGNTGLAAAIVTATYALAGTPAPRTYPASYPYQHAKNLNDVQFGTNGLCELNRQYLCNGLPGYDGPTGLGTPNGTTAFAAPSRGMVTLMDPGTKDKQKGTNVAIRITGLDTRAAATLSYSATGLPTGLSIASLPHSAGAEITGTLPDTIRTYRVAVTGTDLQTGRSGTTHFMIVAAASLTPAAPIRQYITTFTTDDLGPPEGQCLDAGAGTAGTVVGVQTCTGVAEQIWTHLPEGAPGAPSELTSNGLCLGLAGGSLELQTCDRRTATQSWLLLFGGTIKNVGTGTCVATTNTQNPLTMQPCDESLAAQQWTLTGAELTSAIPGMCMATNDDGFHTAPYVIEPCTGTNNTVGFGFGIDNEVISSLDRCMIGARRLDGSGINSGFCTGGFQLWLVGPTGELINESSGLCLDDPGNSRVAGTQLVLEDCYGTLGEIWAIS
jgi:hypothetical protein